MLLSKHLKRPINLLTAELFKWHVTASSVKALLSLPPDGIVLCFPQDLLYVSMTNRLFTFRFHGH